MKRYNLKNIMTRAWGLHRAHPELPFGECLHRSWISEKAIEINADRVQRAAESAGISEEVKTWAGWKKAGYEVQHGSKALFGVTLIWGSRGDGAEYKASFFGASQVAAIATA